MIPEEHAAHARSLSEHDLEIIVSTTRPTSQEAIAARVELARRDRSRTFWRKDIVAWIALALSILSVMLTFYFKKP
jgi:hypothetical protein